MLDIHADHLPDVLYTWKRPLYGLLFPAADAWIVVGRPALKGVSADYFAATDARGQVWVISDAEFLRQCDKTAMHLPTAAPALARKMIAAAVAGGLELSPGWAAACARMARLMDDIPRHVNG